jgi:crotonobetainyl-CoA:carnitine CoA-transferase CaiB-like acyl-CoA transferase
MLQFSATPGTGKAFCEKGEHTQAILAELGFDKAAMRRLSEAGVVQWPAERAEAPAVSS